MKRVMALILTATLGACTAPIAPGGSAAEGVPQVKQPATGAVLQDLPPVIDARSAVRNFLAVVDTVKPIAEAECRARAPDVNCDFRIIVDSRPGLPPNAFQTLDDAGRPIIAFTVPLIAAVRNRDEMAFIMSHEAAHHIQGHLGQQQQNASLGAAVLGGLVGVFAGAESEATEVAQQVGASVGARTYSKDFELEADALGTVIAARAGFNPVRGADFFFRIPDPGNRFLGTHPANADRVAIVRRTAAPFGFR